MKKETRRKNETKVKQQQQKIIRKQHETPIQNGNNTNAKNVLCFGRKLFLHENLQHLN